MIKYKVSYEFERLPKNCRECPAYRSESYQCHNDRGTVSGCELGYMYGDMRDFVPDVRFRGCNLQGDKRVNILEKPQYDEADVLNPTPNIASVIRKQFPSKGIVSIEKESENINRIRYKAILDDDTVVTYDTPNPNVEYVDMYVHTTLENGETKAVRKTYRRYKGKLYDGTEEIG